MMPARLLPPWEVPEMDIRDMKVSSDNGNRYLLVVVDRAYKFPTAFPLSSKEAVGVSHKLLGLPSCLVSCLDSMRPRKRVHRESDEAHFSLTASTAKLRPNQQPAGSGSSRETGGVASLDPDSAVYFMATATG